MSYSDADEFGPEPDWLDGYTGAQEAKEDHFASAGQPLMPGGESTSAQLRRVTAELDELKADVDRMATAHVALLKRNVQAEQDRDQLSAAVAGWVARFHAAYEALYIEEFDGDSCPDLEATIEYAIGAYRRVCESEAAAADQIGQLRADLTAAVQQRDHLSNQARELLAERNTARSEAAAVLNDREALQQERNEARAAQARIGDRMTEDVVRLTAYRRERDLARAELASARTELDLLRTQLQQLQQGDTVENDIMPGGEGGSW